MASPNDVEANGNGHNITRRRSAIRALIQDFEPIWFTWCMNSGILGILTHESPYQFKGLKQISTVFYVFDLVLFAAFSTIFILRFIIFRKHAYHEITSNPTNLLFCACWPIAWMTLTTLTSLICSSASWGHHAFAILGYVMWWIAVAWCFLVLFWAFSVIIERQHVGGGGRVPMGVILPAVSVSTAAVTGAFVVSMGYDISARLAIPVIISSYMLVGMGTFLGLILSTHLFYGYLAHGWLPAEQVTTVFIFVGPMGQGASALMQLGRAARVNGFFAAYNRGPFLSGDAALPIHAVSTMIALMLAGLGFIWVGFGLVAMARSAVRRELIWTHAWNSIIFPTGTLVTAMSLFALEMNSPTFRVAETIMLLALVVVFLLNLGFASWNIAHGKLLIVRDDPRVEKEVEKQEKNL